MALWKALRISKQKTCFEDLPLPLSDYVSFARPRDLSLACGLLASPTFLFLYFRFPALPFFHSCTFEGLQQFSITLSITTAMILHGGVGV